MPTKDGQVVTTIYLDTADRLWVAMHPADATRGSATAYELLVFDRTGEVGEGPLPIARMPLTLDSAGGEITGIVEDRSHRLWFARDGGGLLRYDPATGATATVTSAVSCPGVAGGCSARSLAPGPSGEIWFLTQTAVTGDAGDAAQLHRVDSATLAVRHIELQQREMRPGDDANIQRLAVDPSGILWMGTNAGGVRYADVTAAGLTLYRKEFGTRPGLDSSFVRAVCLSRSNILWVGTPTGLNRIDRSTGTVLRASSPGGLVRLPDPSVQALYEDRDGNLWIGTRSGFVVIAPSGAARRVLGSTSRTPFEDWVQVIHQDRGGTMWLGTMGAGLAEVDPRTRSLTRHRARPGDASTLPSDTVTALLSDVRGHVWVGTEAGLVTFDPARSPRRFERVADRVAGIGDSLVLSLAESGATPGTLWVGTSRGLARLDVGHQSVRHYNSRNSDLADDTVNGILADRGGRLWLSTNRGLVRFDPIAQTFRTFGADPGLQSREFNVRAYFRAPDGEMFFGGVGGLNAFFPEHFPDNPNPPRVFITAVRALDRDSRRPQPDAAIYRHGMAPSAARIPFRQRDVTFDYVALHYADPVRNRYFYRLDDYDTGWQGPTASRAARYTNLGPGSYTFRLRAESSHGVPTDAEARFSFVVLPPCTRRRGSGCSRAWSSCSPRSAATGCGSGRFTGTRPFSSSRCRGAPTNCARRSTRWKSRPRS